MGTIYKENGKGEIERIIALPNDRSCIIISGYGTNIMLHMEEDHFMIPIIHGTRYEIVPISPIATGIKFKGKPTEGVTTPDQRKKMDTAIEQMKKTCPEMTAEDLKKAEVGMNFLLSELEKN